MARRRSFTAAAALAAMAAAGLAQLAPLDAGAAPPWWLPLALRGTALTSVRADGPVVLVQTRAGLTLRSGDGGTSFTAVPTDPGLEAPQVLLSGDDRWLVSPAGAVLHGRDASPLRRDPGAPALGAGAHLVAAPAALPGVVIAVSRDGTVWRRAQDGDWKRALLLLPTGFPGGVPPVTDVAAFTSPLSDTIYLGTDGYSVLASTDGGDDWIRAGPGLPSSVLGLAADSASRSVYAATSDGLWVHRLRALPAPAVYRDAALLGRWLGILAVSVAGAAAAVGLMRWCVRAPRP